MFENFPCAVYYVHSKSLDAYTWRLQNSRTRSYDFWKQVNNFLQVSVQHACGLSTIGIFLLRMFCTMYTNSKWKLFRWPPFSFTEGRKAFKKFSRTFPIDEGGLPSVFGNVWCCNDRSGRLFWTCFTGLKEKLKPCRGTRACLPSIFSTGRKQKKNLCSISNRSVIPHKSAVRLKAPCLKAAVQLHEEFL